MGNKPKALFIAFLLSGCLQGATIDVADRGKAIWVKVDNGKCIDSISLETIKDNGTNDHIKSYGRESLDASKYCASGVNVLKADLLKTGEAVPKGRLMLTVSGIGFTASKQIDPKLFGL